MMAKRTLRAESKKECPSCGLGVTPESTICEFCGWNFEEEDEWILQIEKLERDLMLEKQRYEPGTVDHMLESTLRSPLVDRVESTVPQDEDAVEVEDTEPHEDSDTIEEEFVPEETVEEPAAEHMEEEPETVASPVAEPEETKVRRVRSVRMPAEEPEREPMRPEPADEPQAESDRTGTSMPIRRVRAVAQQTPQRRVRTVAQEPEPEVEDEPRPVRRTRTVRRVKR